MRVSSVLWAGDCRQQTIHCGSACVVRSRLTGGGGGSGEKRTSGEGSEKRPETNKRSLTSFGSGRLKQLG